MMNNRVYIVDYKNGSSIDKILKTLAECRYIIIRPDTIIVDGTSFNDIECKSVLMTDGIVNIDVREVVDWKDVWILNFH